MHTVQQIAAVDALAVRTAIVPLLTREPIGEDRLAALVDPMHTHPVEVAG